MIDVKLSDERKEAINKIGEELFKYDSPQYATQMAIIYELRRIREVLSVLLDGKDQTPQPRKNKKQSNV